MELLRARPVTDAEVVISEDDAAAIERELSQIMPGLEITMLEDYRSRMNR